MKFGARSIEQLSTCHKDLQKIFYTAIEITDIDFGISEGQRSTQKQRQYFDQGKSKIDGIIKKGKHNYVPSLAADIYIYKNGKAEWGNEDLTYIAGLIKGVSELLYEYGEVDHKIRWGGNWDMDGEILVDQSFDDRPHFELIKIKENV